ncbi:MAG: hypothetical protein IH935_06445 [Acidobacteria bacterium]|nr:hypothetical protein [Acidobacteriota bacterium]
MDFITVQAVYAATKKNRVVRVFTHAARACPTKLLRLTLLAKKSNWK